MSLRRPRWSQFERLQIQDRVCGAAKQTEVSLHWPEHHREQEVTQTCAFTMLEGYKCVWCRSWLGIAAVPLRSTMERKKKKKQKNPSAALRLAADSGFCGQSPLGALVCDPLRPVLS